MRRSSPSAQLAFDFSSPPPADTLADRLVATGFAPNRFILDLNRTVSCDNSDFAYPWCLPSRAFRFPVEWISSGRGGGPDRLLMHHPDLGGHPLMAKIEASIGERPGFEAVDEYGRDISQMSNWWHAVDLMTERHWRDLLETRRFTTTECLLRAVAFALECPGSWEGRGKTKGLISTTTARAVLAELGCDEPADRSVTGLSGSALMGGEIVAEKSKAIHYPVNLIARGAPGAWAMVHGLEDGWFLRDRGGHLQITATGRARRGGMVEVARAA